MKLHDSRRITRMTKIRSMKNKRVILADIMLFSVLSAGRVRVDRLETGIGREDLKKHGLQ